NYRAGGFGWPNGYKGMTQTNMPDKSTRKPNRIPVRFDDEAQAGRGDEGAPEVKTEGGVSPEEVGRESAYEDATEVERRVGRGQEQDTEAGRARADEADAAGTVPRAELPRSRDEQDTTASRTTDDEKAGERKAAGGEAARAQDEQQRGTGPLAGPVLAELVATRAELRRVEAELKKLADERQ